ncbi:MAG TPA: outer membrane protein assembly factor BamA [Smithellaceae bacterium]|nr:outer membrane protein assembly factor BamA [Smithellaceae bacterium]
MMFNKLAVRLLILLLWTACLLPCSAQAQSVKKILIQPFDVYSQTGASELQQSFLSLLKTELKKEQRLEVADHPAPAGSATQAGLKKILEAAKARNIDYVLEGSITRFGETLNVDARVMDVAGGTTLPPISVSGKTPDGLDALAAKLKTSLLSALGLIEVIARVDVAGNRKISAAAITEHIKSRPGRLYDPAALTDDIRTIFKMGFFLDVSASVATEPQGRVITFTVQEKGLISEILIIGNKALKRDDILEVMTVKTRQSLNPDRLKADIQKIKELYDGKGYYNAKISERIERDGEKDYRVVLEIEENSRVYIRSIVFDGIEAFTNKQLVNMMTTSERTLLGFITDTGILQTAALLQDIQKINAFYFNSGYINAQIGDPVVTHDGKGIYIKIPVREGKRFNVGSVGISGDFLNKPRTELLDKLKTKSGRHYDREAVLKDIEMISQAAQDEGYAHADVDPKITIREKEQLVDIDFRLAKGELIYISRIGITGNTITRDKVIRRQLSLVEGDLYSSTKLKNSYERLNQLRYFEEIDIQTAKADEDKMDVNIHVKEKNTGMFMIGAGYSAVDQAIIMGQVTQQNFLGYGQILNLKATLGSRTNQYELSFTEPALFDLPLWAKADLWRYKKEYDSYTLQTQGGGLTVGYPLIEKIIGYVGYRLSFDDIRDVNQDTASEYIKLQAGERITSSVTFSLLRDTTDDTMFPSKGVKASLSIQQAGGVLGGNAHFTKYQAAASYYYPLPLDFVFCAKGRVGFLQNNDDDDSKIPVYERFVLGGITSLRGLRYVGPTNPGTSDVIGGTRMVNFSLELIFPLIKDAGMKGVVFYDAGNTWNSGIYLDDLCQTAGVGVRWYSPIGPLRLEYGWVLDRRNLIDESKGRWEFTIGMFM